MKDEHSKALVIAQGQESMIIKTRGVHLVGVRDTPVIIRHNEWA
jgi:hypothetical protein